MTIRVETGPGGSYFLLHCTECGVWRVQLLTETGVNAEGRRHLRDAHGDWRGAAVWANKRAERMRRRG